jgi:molybdate transport system substrate-binding protein
VFAAASLQTALDEIVAAFTAATGAAVTVSYAGSSTLARQIESGAQADVFISADLDWMDYLQERNLIDPASRTDLLGNRIVLVAPAASTIELRIGTDPIAGALGTDDRIAMADVEAVPATLPEPDTIEEAPAQAVRPRRKRRTRRVSPPHHGA